jgi:hypothetical protein
MNRIANLSKRKSKGVVDVDVLAAAVVVISMGTWPLLCFDFNYSKLIFFFKTGMQFLVTKFLAGSSSILTDIFVYCLTNW